MEAVGAVVCVIDVPVADGLDVEVPAVEPDADGDCAELQPPAIRASVRARTEPRSRPSHERVRT